MFIDWLKPWTEKIEAATVELECSLQLDDPCSPDRTTYQHPKEAFTQACIASIRPSIRSVVLTSRLLEIHFESKERQLLHIDIISLCDQQAFWQRRLCEGFVDLLLLERTGTKDIYTGYLNKQKADKRSKFYNELKKDYACTMRVLDVYCANDEAAAKEHEDILKPLLASYEQRVESAWSEMSDDERFAVGTYFNFRVRSGAVHFGTFQIGNSEADIDLLMFNLTITTLLSKQFIGKLARLFPIGLKSIANLNDTELEAMFRERHQEAVEPQIAIDEEIIVIQGNREYRGIVKEIRSGKYGKSYRIQDIPGQRKWCSVNDFHPAIFVRKIQ